MRHILQPLKKVQIKIGLKKLENHKRVVVKALLDSSATGLFMDTQFVKRKGFKLERLKNSLLVRNINEIVNVGRAITHQVECNMFFKGHIERVKMDIYNLGKTEVILDMPQLAAHNPEIDWEKGKVKIIRCLPICEKKKQEEKEKKVRKTEKKKEVEELVLKRFWKQKKVFGKVELERILVQKVWDHAIELRKDFIPKKGKVYLLLRKEREGASICRRSTAKRIYSTIKIATDIASTFCS